jgi:hypothetical protein
MRICVNGNTADKWFGYKWLRQAAVAEFVLFSQPDI